MWIFTKYGFISVVQHNSIEGYFQVKSRVIDPLEILWPGHDVEIIDWADYRYRITLPRTDVALVLIEKGITGIDYTSFKDECRNDHDYHDALVKVWSTMYNYQLNMERR
tara:strand:- start:3027 stop:3353 length:327 start_codon:yes stop_codon:yes gene_type:complete